jgi:hypothetical protein
MIGAPTQNAKVGVVGFVVSRLHLHRSKQCFFARAGALGQAFQPKQATPIEATLFFAQPSACCGIYHRKA